MRGEIISNGSTNNYLMGKTKKMENNLNKTRVNNLAVPLSKSVNFYVIKHFKIKCKYARESHRKRSLERLLQELERLLQEYLCHYGREIKATARLIRKPRTRLG